MEKKNIFFPVKAIFTSSEPLYDVHRKVIETRFKAKIFDLYGQAERVAAATECTEHKGLHVNPEYGVLEIIKDNRDARDGEDGEIVGTGLNNYSMPLIRYRTGDVARFSPKPCPCGRKMPVLQFVDGRIADRIITPEGRIIPGGGIMGAFHGIDNIKECQVIQEDRYNLIIRIAKDNDSMEIDSEKLLFNLNKCIGKEMKLTIDLADSVFDDDMVKRRWVLSKVEVDT